jgi:hypothetical protein
MLEERRPGWQANIKLDPENRWDGVNWVKPAQDRDHYGGLVKTVQEMCRILLLTEQLSTIQYLFWPVNIGQKLQHSSMYVPT